MNTLIASPDGDLSGLTYFGLIPGPLPAIALPKSGNLSSHTLSSSNQYDLVSNSSLAYSSPD